MSLILWRFVWKHGQNGWTRKQKGTHPVSVGRSLVSLFYLILTTEAYRIYARRKMGNEYFFSLSSSPNFRASLPLADSAMTINKITFFHVFWELKQTRFWATPTTHHPEWDDKHPGPFQSQARKFKFILNSSGSDKRENGRKSATITYIRRVFDARQSQRG